MTSLRPATVADLDLFFRFQTDPEANRMAAFTCRDPHDREAYVGGWTKRLSDPSIRLRAIEHKREVIGSVASFLIGGQREITYWLDPKLWGRGLATSALTQFLAEEPERPLQARVAKHNLGSCRVLEKCGFRRLGQDAGYSDYLRAEVEEWIYELA